jgi:hypothetical protein
MRHLPALARLLVELGVDQYQIAFPHPSGHAATYFNGVVPRMRDLAPHAMAALQVGIDAGVRCLVEAMPYCQLPGYERHVAELHIPPTEIAYDGFVVPDYARDRMERGKTRFPQCATCRFEPMCEGPWRGYPEVVGGDEFQPVAGPRVADAAVVLDDRFDLLGAAALPLAALDGREARWLALVFYPEEGSPSCTIQAQSLAAGREALTAAGIDAVRVCPDPTTARAWRLIDGQRFRRTTYLLGPRPPAGGPRPIRHILVAPDIHRHAAQIVDAVTRFEAPPRPLARGEELVVIRRPKPAAEVAHELALSPGNPDEFAV